MLVEVHDGKFGHVEVEELDGAIAACYRALVFVDF